MYVFFFNDTATTEIYTLSLHDALPIFQREGVDGYLCAGDTVGHGPLPNECVERIAGLDVVSVAGNHELIALDRLSDERDRKSTRLNSSHANISYAVFCLKKKKSMQKSL